MAASGPTTIQGPPAVTGELVAGASRQPPSMFVQFKHVLDRGMDQIRIALPKHIDPIRFYRVILTAMQSPPKPGQLGILDCTQESVFSCMLTCAQLGLEPNGPQGHAYLIPFRDNNAQSVVCTLVIGFKGLIKLARNSGEIAGVTAHVVHQKDFFDYEYGLNERCAHRPTDEEDPGPVIAAYAVWRLKDGGHHFDVMTRKELDRIKNRKNLPAFSPWKSDEEEMQRKTIIRRSSKMVPNSIELAKGIESNDRQEEGLAPIPFEAPAASLPAVTEPQAIAESPKEQPKNLDEAAARARAKREAKAAGTDAKGDAAPEITPGKGEGTKPATTSKPAGPAKASPQKTREIALACAAKGIDMATIVKRYNVASTSEITDEQADEAIEQLAAAPDKDEAEPGSQG